MGKKLVIKGADFSQNGLRNYKSILNISNNDFFIFSRDTEKGDAYCYGETSTVTQQKLNVPIIGIRILPVLSGIIPVRVASFSNDYSPYTSIRFIQNITVSPVDIGIIKNYFLNSPIELSSGEKIVFGFEGLTASWKYGEDILEFNTGISLTTNGEESSWIVSANYSLGVDYLTYSN